MGNFYTFDFASHLAEDDDDEGEIIIDFGTVDITEKDSSESERENNVGNFKLLTNKYLSITVINDITLKKRK